MDKEDEIDYIKRTIKLLWSTIDNRIVQDRDVDAYRYGQLILTDYLKYLTYERIER